MRHLERLLAAPVRLPEVGILEAGRAGRARSPPASSPSHASITGHDARRSAADDPPPSPERDKRHTPVTRPRRRCTRASVKEIDTHARAEPDDDRRSRASQPASPRPQPRSGKRAKEHAHARDQPMMPNSSKSEQIGRDNDDAVPPHAPAHARSVTAGSVSTGPESRSDLPGGSRCGSACTSSTSANSGRNSSIESVRVFWKIVTRGWS